MIDPGSGLPTDLADARTPVAHTPEDVRRLAASAVGVRDVDARSSVCRACPRLVAWREEVARTKRAAYADQTYWGRPVTGWGPHDAPILVMGLAPAAHGGNRTGRVFTGDRSGDWLFAALHRAGLANQPTSVAADDGLELRHTRIVVPVRCAPPENKPLPAERDACAPWLHRELALVLPQVRVIVALGGFAWTQARSALTALGHPGPRPAPAFGHGVQVLVEGGPTLLGCYHVSQQNTFTGRLTETMLDDVLSRARALAGL